MQKIRKYEVKETLKIMKARKVFGLNGISIEVWRYLGGWMIDILTRFDKLKKLKLGEEE